MENLIRRSQVDIISIKSYQNSNDSYLKNVNGQISNMETIINSLKTDTQLNKNDITSWKNSIDILQTDNPSNKNEITILKKNILNKSNISTLLNDNTDNKSKISTLSTDLSYFKQTLSDVLVKQNLNDFWRLIYFDDFETDKSFSGWSETKIVKWSSQNTILEGHCNFSITPVYKIYENIPPHTSLRIKASYSMFNTWDGESGYMYIDDIKVWEQKQNGISSSTFNSISIVAFNIPIDVTIIHTNKTVKITFGSTLNQQPCDESFGIDDVIILIK